MTTKLREQTDTNSWETLSLRQPMTSEPEGYAASGRPANFIDLSKMFEEIDDFDHAWSEFLHEFYRYKRLDFFTKPPTNSLPVERQVFLAAAAEALCTRFNLPIPEWTQNPAYTLPEPWDPDAFWYTDVPLASRMAGASPIFLKHNVIFAERGLIAL